MLALFGLLNVSLSLGSEFSNEVYAAEGDNGNSDEDGKLSVTISGDLEQTTPAVAGETAYRSHNVQVNGSNIDSYTMQISYGSGSSMLENTPILDGTEPTVISGADGRNASSTDDNWWGYSWDDNDKAEDTLIFQTMPAYGSGTQLEGGKPTDGTVSVDKTLTFAAKFGSDAAAGHYKAGVLLSLAASPKKVTASGFGGITTMQEMTPQVCASVEPGTVGELEDARDHTIYTVARIKNKAGDTTDAGANCWMTQNLALDLEQYWNKDTMVTSLSDVPSDDYWTQRSIGAATKKNQGFTASGSNYNLIEYTNTTTTGSGDDKLKVYSGTYDPSYGYYYTWCAATVGCKDSSGNIPSSGDVVASICPKGWQLPSGNTNGQWYNLLNGTSKPYIDNLAADPYKIPAAGYMNSSGFNNGGTSGYYWSRTALDTNNAYRLDFNSSYFYPGTGYSNRYVGYSVRCVAKPAPTMDTITYMQEMTPEICSKATVGDTKTGLIDERDTSNTYNIAKFKDGNCWMTQNLRIMNKTLTSADSDLPAGTEFVLPATSTKNTFTDANRNTKQVYSGSDSINNTVYYNWYTATAGSGNASVTTGNVNVTSSICPKGWELPTDGASGQFQALATAIGNTSTSTWRGTPYNFVATGYVYDGSLSNTSYSYYWSRTSYSDTDAYILYMNSSTVYPQDDYNRCLGFAVRCVAQTTANKQY